MEIKEIELLKWMLDKKIFSTHEVIRWGDINKYARADRTKRNFKEIGLLYKLSDVMKKLKGFTCKDAVYEINKKEAEDYFNCARGVHKQEKMF